MNPSGDFSRYATIIREEHLPALKEGLSKIPDFSWLLSKPHAEIERLQGDLVADLPAVVIGDDGTARTRSFTTMVMNNTCDLPKSRIDFITTAPVVDFQKYVEFEKTKRDENSLKNYVEAIRRNEKTELFYLPPFGEFSNGALALLHLACPVSASLYHQALKNKHRKASFTQIGFYFLLIKLTTHIARPETSEVVRSTSDAKSEATPIGLWKRLKSFWMQS
jgi:hypothetical protein